MGLKVSARGVQMNSWAIPSSWDRQEEQSHEEGVTYMSVTENTSQVFTDSCSWIRGC